MAMLSVSARRDDAAATVAVAGELDIAARPLVMARTTQILRGGPGCLVVDASGVTFTDAAGVGVLVAVRVRAARQRTVLELAGVPPCMLRVMDLTGVRGHFRILP